MANIYRTYAPLNSKAPQAIKWLLASNIGLFLLYFFSMLAGLGRYWEPLLLVPADVLQRFHVWQLVTYMFLHDPFGVWHILLNMLVLWMFGEMLLYSWGDREFLKYYFTCGVGAAICIILVDLVLFPSHLTAPTLGASAAIYGLLFAFGYLFPNEIIMFMFVVPMKAKYAVMIYGAIAFLSSLRGGDGVSHIGHLSGMLVGYVYLKLKANRRRPAYARSSSAGFLDSIQQQYKEWKIQRARRKFEVYMKERDRNKDRFVH